MANRSKFGVDLSPKGKAKRTYKGITFRSLLEKDWAVHLDTLKAAGEIEGWEYEPVRIPIHVDGELVCTYTPDFRILKWGVWEYHEVKGRVTSEWSLKLRLLKATWLKTFAAHMSYYVITRPRGMEWQKKAPVKPAMQTTTATS